MNQHKLAHLPDKIKLMGELRDLTSPEGGTIVEVGCYVGITTGIFSGGNRTVYAVDVWDYAHHCLTWDLDQEDNGRHAFRIFCENNADKLLSKIFPLRGESAEIAKIFPFMVDMVYIDADHSYEKTKEDITLWGKHVKPDGWICGDDYSLEGVTKAVSECFTQHNKWYGEQWGARREWLRS